MSCLFKYNLCSYWEDQIWTICILYPTIRFTIEWSDAVPYPVSGDNNSTDSHYCCDSWNTGTSIWNVAYLNLIKYDCLYSMCSIFIGMSFQKRVCKLCYIYIYGHVCDWLLICIIGTLQALKADLQKGTCMCYAITITSGYRISSRGSVIISCMKCTKILEACPCLINTRPILARSYLLYLSLNLWKSC